jgi:hypothetical protein
VRTLVKQRVRWSFGVLQSMWKHRRALIERRAGAFGRLVLPTMILFQVVLPLLVPAALAAAVAALAAGNFAPALYATTALLGVELVHALTAGLLERRTGGRGGLRLVGWLVAGRLLYRPLLLLVLARSLGRVLDGIPLGWGKLARRGTVTGA